MNSKMILGVAASALLLSACSEIRDVQLVGSWADPYCAPDSSVVLGVFPNDKGNYRPIESSRENCSWHAKDETAPSSVEVASN